MACDLNDVDKNSAFMLELLPGLIGFLGIGHIYSGDIAGGLLRLIIWPMIVGFAWVTISFLMFILVGFCLIPVMIVIQIIVPVLSAFHLRKRLEEAYPE
jgi:hypothetical protein